MFNAAKLTLTGLILIAATGCTTNTANYGASFDNIETLKNHNGVHVSVEGFTSSKSGVSSINCRGGFVATPDKESFESYIHNAFVSELKVAGIYAENAPVTLKGHFTKIDFNSMIGNGKWVFELTASSSNNKELKISSIHKFSTNLFGGKACQQVAQEFSPAVQVLIRDLITNSKFQELINPVKQDLDAKI